MLILSRNMDERVNIYVDGVRRASIVVREHDRRKKQVKLGLEGDEAVHFRRSEIDPDWPSATCPRCGAAVFQAGGCPHCDWKPG